MNFRPTPVNNEELELAKNFEGILMNNLGEYNNEVIEEISLHFQEFYKDCEITPIDYKMKAVEFWRSTKILKNLSIKAVANRYKKVK